MRRAITIIILMILIVMVLSNTMVVQYSQIKRINQKSQTKIRDVYEERPPIGKEKLQKEVANREGNLGDRGIVPMEMRTPTSWHILIDTPGYYELTEDIIDCAEECGIYINASNVVLDGKDHILDGVYSGLSMYGIYVENVSNVTIKNITIQEWSYYGILYHSSNDNTIVNTTLRSNKCGVYLWDALNNTIVDNIFINNGIVVLYSYENNITRNTLNGKPIIYMEGEEDKSVDEEAGQIILVRCINITIEEQRMESTDLSIELWETNQTTIRNTTLRNITTGIFLFSSNNNSINNNSILNNTNGIYLQFSNNNSIVNNTILLNGTYGIRIDYSRNNSVMHNMVQNSTYGIYLSQSMNSSIVWNIIQNNTYGIYLHQSPNNTVYLNNFINNTYQFVLFETYVYRFYSPEPITYIYRGDTYTNYTGNYWSDYTGEDTNGDGIGEEPYAPDQYPLMGKVMIISREVIIGTTPPDVRIIRPCSGDYLNTSSVTVEWSAIDLNNDIDYSEIRIDSKSWINVGINTNYTFTNVSDGKHTVCVRVYDRDQNYDEEKVTFTVDTRPPTIAILSPSNDSKLGSSSVTVEWNASDNGSGISHFMLYLDDILIAENISADQLSYELNVSEGAHQVIVVAIDRAGNRAESCVDFVVEIPTTTSPTTPVSTIVLYLSALVAVAVVVSIVLFAKRRS
ncbi:MAG: NosD domain-containing protein [Candidatus Njordarchaeota archaeon]